MIHATRNESELADNYRPQILVHSLFNLNLFTIMALTNPTKYVSVQRLQRFEPSAYKKVAVFIDELRTHPKTGTGHPEPLKGKPEGRWSRQITKKHRLVYRIYEMEVHVDILSSYGHYDDK